MNVAGGVTPEANSFADGFGAALDQMREYAVAGHAQERAAQHKLGLGCFWPAAFPTELMIRWDPSVAAVLLALVVWQANAQAPGELGWARGLKPTPNRTADAGRHLLAEGSGSLGRSLTLLTRSFSPLGKDGVSRSVSMVTWPGVLGVLAALSPQRPAFPATL